MYKFPTESTAAPFGPLNPVEITVRCAPRNATWAGNAETHSRAASIAHGNLGLTSADAISLANDIKAFLTKYPLIHMACPQILIVKQSRFLTVVVEFLAT